MRARNCDFLRYKVERSGRREADEEILNSPRNLREHQEFSQFCFRSLFRPSLPLIIIFMLSRINAQKTRAHRTPARSCRQNVQRERACAVVMRIAAQFYAHSFNFTGYTYNSRAARTQEGWGEESLQLDSKLMSDHDSFKIQQGCRWNFLNSSTLFWRHDDDDSQVFRRE